MLRAGHAVLIKIHAFYQELKICHLQLLEVIFLYYFEDGMRIERYKEDCYDLSILLAAEEQLFQEFSRHRINLTRL